MTTTDALVEFLRARLDELEQAAREAQTPDRWWVDGPAMKSGRWWVYDTGAKFESRDMAVHIALNDPAYVLADVDSKRRVIEMYEGAVAALSKVGGDLDAEAILRATVATCEVTVRLLALPFADHPDYREEWKP